MKKTCSYIMEFFFSPGKMRRKRRLVQIFLRIPHHPLKMHRHPHLCLNSPSHHLHLLIHLHNSTQPLSCHRQCPRDHWWFYHQGPQCQLFVSKNNKESIFNLGYIVGMRRTISLPTVFIHLCQSLIAWLKCFSDVYRNAAANAGSVPSVYARTSSTPGIPSPHDVSSSSPSPRNPPTPTGWRATSQETEDRRSTDSRGCLLG